MNTVVQVYNPNNWKVGAGELGVQIQSGLYEIISQMKAKIINTSKKSIKYQQIETSVKEIEITKIKKLYHRMEDKVDLKINKSFNLNDGKME